MYEVKVPGQFLGYRDFVAFVTQPQADDLGKIFGIPAENNLAERELRSLVIARKISFGSQSKTGLETRETLMSVLHTLAKRCENALDAFVAMLDSLVENPELDVAAHLFGRAPDAAPS